MRFFLIYNTGTSTASSLHFLVKFYELIIRISITIRLQPSWQINLKRFSHTQTNHATHFDVFFMKLFWYQNGKAREQNKNKRRTVSNIFSFMRFVYFCNAFIKHLTILSVRECERQFWPSYPVHCHHCPVLWPLEWPRVGPPFGTTTMTTTTMGSPKNKFMRLPCRKCVFSKCFKLYNENLWRTAGSLREKVKIAC